MGKSDTDITDRSETTDPDVTFHRHPFIITHLISTHDSNRKYTYQSWFKYCVTIQSINICTYKILKDTKRFLTSEVLSLESRK